MVFRHSDEAHAGSNFANFTQVIPDSVSPTPEDVTFTRENRRTHKRFKADNSEVLDIDPPLEHLQNQQTSSRRRKESHMESESGSNEYDLQVNHKNKSAMSTRTNTYLEVPDLGDGSDDTVTRRPLTGTGKRKRVLTTADNEESDTADSYRDAPATANRRSGRVPPSSYNMGIACRDREESTLFMSPGPGGRHQSSAPSTPVASSKSKSVTYASEMKERMLAAGRGGFGIGAGRKNSPAKNEENIMIKDLRQNERLSWDEIAKQLNERRVANGQQTGLTAASVYGRFVRNAPLIAEMNGENDFDIQNYMHLQEHRKRAKHAGPAVDREPGEMPMPHFSEEDDRKLCLAVQHVDNDRWNAIAAEFKNSGGFSITPYQAAKRFKMI